MQFTGFFDDFLAESPELLDSKNYRDLIIHHANIDLSLFSKIATETGYTIFSHFTSTITKAGPYNYIQNLVTKKDVVEFARKALFVYLSVISRPTDKVLRDSRKQHQALDFN
jgi:hypothetical protein